AADFNQLLLAEATAAQSSQWLVMLMPLKLADTAVIDPRSKLTGALVALLSLQQIRQQLEQYTPDACLLNIYWQDKPLLPATSEHQADSVITQAQLQVPGLDSAFTVTFATSRAVA